MDTKDVCGQKILAFQDLHDAGCAYLVGTRSPHAHDAVHGIVVKVVRGFGCETKAELDAVACKGHCVAGDNTAYGAGAI